MKVSVKMITYNHEKFIAQAIESVMMQQVNFDYELVIGEDCSTDNTRQIVIEYQKRYPDKIRLLLPEKNLGARENSRRVIQACRGQYFAVLEGDDYWTSPHKLQKQVDFLDSHPECAICFHNAKFFRENDSQEPWIHRPPNQKEISTIEDILVSCFIPNCSVMFRNGLFDEFPEAFNQLPMGDWPTHVLNAQHGNIGYINEVMAAYRIHEHGAWSSRSAAQRIIWSLQFYHTVNPFLDFKYNGIIKPRAAEHWESLAAQLIQMVRKSPQDGFWEVMHIFNEWPDGLPISKDWKSNVLRQVYREVAPKLLFESYEQRDMAKTRHFWLKTVRYTPTWLINRGFWSIGLKALVGF